MKTQPSILRSQLTSALFLIAASILINLNLAGKDFSNETFSSILYTFLISLTLLQFRAGKATLLIATVISAFYLPTALITGVISRGVLLAILETDTREALGFIKSIPKEYIIYSVLSGAITIFLLLKSKPIRTKRKILVAALSLSFALGLHHASRLHLLPESTLSRSVTGLKKLYREYYILDISELPEPEWRVIKKERKYHTYIVILGESLRKDVLPDYGFPIDTTPFLSQAPAEHITNFYAPAVNTSLSVPRIIALSDGHGVVQEQNNAITLAQAAGFKTYWISSQGFTGPNNRTAGRIAQYADDIHFEESFTTDFALFPHIKSAISEKREKVVFIHTTGSHEDPCDRLDDFGTHYNQIKDTMLNCYLSTVKKTDFFIKEIYQYLEKNSNSFSIVYTSDHGLGIRESITGEYKVHRDPDLIESYAVPFFVLSSDSSNKNIHSISGSGYDFINFFATWLGVKTNLTIDNFNIFKQRTKSPPLVMGYELKKEKITEKKPGLSLSELFIQKVNNNNKAQ